MFLRFSCEPLFSASELGSPVHAPSAATATTSYKYIHLHIFIITGEVWVCASHEMKPQGIMLAHRGQPVTAASCCLLLQSPACRTALLCCEAWATLVCQSMDADREPGATWYCRSPPLSLVELPFFYRGTWHWWLSGSSISVDCAICWGQPVCHALLKIGLVPIGASKYLDFVSHICYCFFFGGKGGREASGVGVLTLKEITHDDPPSAARRVHQVPEGPSWTERR